MGMHGAGLNRQRRCAASIPGSRPSWEPGRQAAPGTSPPRRVEAGGPGRRPPAPAGPASVGHGAPAAVSPRSGLLESHEPARPDAELHDIRLADMDLRLGTWRRQLQRRSYLEDPRLQAAEAGGREGKTLSLYSQPFYTGYFGYKMRQGLPERGRHGQGHAPLALLRHHARASRRAAALALQAESDAHADGPGVLAAAPGGHAQAGPQQQQLQEAHWGDEHRLRVPCSWPETVPENGTTSKTTIHFYQSHSGYFGPAGPLTRPRRRIEQKATSGV